MNRLLSLFVMKKSNQQMKISGGAIIFLLALPVFLLSFFAVEKSFAQGLQVLPTRIVFEDRQRSAQVFLINQGTKKATYRISFQNIRMTDEGAYEEVKEPLPEEKFAQEFIRYSPRQVVLEPGSSQTIRLLLRKKSKLPAGEYRSHMLFQSVPDKDAGKDIESLKLKSKEISVKLIPIYGVSIPVIFRHGKGFAKATIHDLSFRISEKEGEKDRLGFTVKRKGNHSLYGDLVVTFKPEKGGELVEVGRMNGLAVYSPNKYRKFNIELNPPEGVEIKNGIIKLAYKKQKSNGDGSIASVQLQLP